MGISFMCSSVALLYNNLVKPTALEAIGWKYYLVFMAMLVQWVFVIYFFYPETRGHSLEELTNLFDGPAWGLRKTLRKSGNNEPIGEKVEDLDSKADITVHHVE